MFIADLWPVCNDDLQAFIRFVMLKDTVHQTFAAHGLMPFTWPGIDCLFLLFLTS
jgi:hypothetical protein